jgi:hypothetical protein
MIRSKEFADCPKVDLSYQILSKLTREAIIPDPTSSIPPLGFRYERYTNDRQSKVIEGETGISG